MCIYMYLISYSPEIARLVRYDIYWHLASLVMAVSFPGPTGFPTITALRNPRLGPCALIWGLCSADRSVSKKLGRLSAFGGRRA